MTTPKTGPLTFEDLRDVWRGAVDDSYSEPLERQGDGHGIEAYSQMWEVYARVSRAVDITTQAMFILPHSGQTNPPAQGEAKATVTLTFERFRFNEKPLRLAAGSIIAAHQIVDWGENGGVEAFTGLRYILTEDLVFNPSERGPYTVAAEAEKAGYSFNDPLPNTIVYLPQVGAGFENDHAVVTVVGPTALIAPAVAQVTVQAANEADMFVPEHVGQQLIFTGGLNVGKVARIKAFYPPQPNIFLGSRVDLEITQSVQGTVFAGTFLEGEDINFTNGGPTIATGRVFVQRINGLIKRVTYEVLRGNFAAVIASTVITGVQSGATMTISVLLFPQLFVNEPDPPGATWRILFWDGDWDLTVTNVEAPEGGRAGWLDELGAERNIHRAPGEVDDPYRKRVATPADVVTPNAIRRALTRSLGTIPWCFREVGTPLLPGHFFDFDAYDYDVFAVVGVVASGTFQLSERVVLEQYNTGPLLTKTVGYFGRLELVNTVLTFIRVQNQPPPLMAPGVYRVRGLSSGAIFNITSGPTIGATVVDNRFRVILDYPSFRGYFLIGVPRLGIGEFGFAFDAGPNNAFDAPVFFDGFPADVRSIYARVRQAIDQVHAGGVGFDLYLTNEPCTASLDQPGDG